MDMTPTVRFRLAEVLAELGWTQRELAEKTGLSENSISNLMRSPSSIHFDTLAKLSQVTGKSISDLIVYDPE